MKKILINKTDNSTILISKVRTENQQIAIKKYEFGILKEIDAFNIKLEDTFIIADNNAQVMKSYEEIYEQLALQLNDYEISEDFQNWQILQGSTGTDTTVRVFLPNILLGIELGSGSILDGLIQSMLALNAFKKNTINGSLLYLEEINPSDRTFLESEENVSNGIIVEDKVI